jgi:general secretion pathway protein M
MDPQRDFQVFWSERAPRERRILTIGAIFLVLLALYLLLVGPAVAGIDRLQRLLPQSLNQAAELEALVAEAKHLRGLAPAAAPGAADARSAVGTALETAGLQASRNTPQANGDLHLTFTNVPYSRWATWLAGVEKNLGVHTSAVTVKASATPGNADIELSLRLPHA